MSDLDAKLAEIAAQYDDLQAALARPEVTADPNEIRRLGRELARLEPTVAAFRTLTTTRDELSGARELRDASDGDEDLRAMARDEVARLEADEARLLEELRVLLLPRDPNDERDVILEVRAGAGGEEAALFAAEAERLELVAAGSPGSFSPSTPSSRESESDSVESSESTSASAGFHSRPGRYTLGSMPG